MLKQCRNLILYMVLITVSTMAFAFQVPELHARVNDNAHMFSVATVAELENSLAAIEHANGVQVAILTIESLNGVPLESAAIKTANTWALGTKGKDDGLLIFIAKNDRAVRMEVGAGLEATITDLKAGRIIDEIIRPNFKAGHFDQGITEAVAELRQQISGGNTTPFATRSAAEYAKLGDITQASLLLRMLIYITIIACMARIAYINAKREKKLLAERNLQVIDESVLSPELQKTINVRRRLVYAHTLLLPLLTVDYWFPALDSILFGVVLTFIGYKLGQFFFMHLTGYENNIDRTSTLRSYGSNSWTGGGGGFSGRGGGFRGGGASGRW